MSKAELASSEVIDSGMLPLAAVSSKKIGVEWGFLKPVGVPDSFFI